VRRSDSVFLLQSGIVQGNLFPGYESLGLLERLVPMADGQPKGASLRVILPSPSLALRFIGCFLARVFERFAPSSLTSTEQYCGEAEKGVKK
jgi:hypothetical protein